MNRRPARCVRATRPHHGTARGARAQEDLMSGTGPTAAPAGRATGAGRTGLGGALGWARAVVAVDVAGAPSAQAASLTRFGSCEELTGWYRDAALEQVTAWGQGGGGMMFDRRARRPRRAPVAAPRPRRGRGRRPDRWRGRVVRDGHERAGGGRRRARRVKLADGLAYRSPTAAWSWSTSRRAGLGRVDLGTGVRTAGLVLRPAAARRPRRRAGLRPAARSVRPTR